MTGCFLVLVPIGILARRCEHVGSPLVTSSWQCIVAATAEELLEKDPDPFKSVADGKYPCFILKRALTNGPQLVRKLVAVQSCTVFSVVSIVLKLNDRIGFQLKPGRVLVV